MRRDKLHSKPLFKISWQASQAVLNVLQQQRPGGKDSSPTQCVYVAISENVDILLGDGEGENTIFSLAPMLCTVLFLHHHHAVSLGLQPPVRG